MTGTIINFLSVLVGGIVGWQFKKLLSKRMIEVSYEAMGLALLALGISMIVKMDNPLFLIVTTLVGGIIGTLLEIDFHLNQTANNVKRVLKIREEGMVNGLVTMFLAACVGSLAILGPINEGLTGDKSLLLTKSILDLVTAVVLSSSFGLGVVFTSAPLLIFQGTLTLLATMLKPFVTSTLIAGLNGVGGILILGIGLNILKLAKIKTANYLPALVITILLAIIFG